MPAAPREEGRWCEEVVVPNTLVFGVGQSGKESELLWGPLWCQEVGL